MMWLIQWDTEGYDVISLWELVINHQQVQERDYMEILVIATINQPSMVHERWLMTTISTFVRW